MKLKLLVAASLALIAAAIIGQSLHAQEDNDSLRSHQRLPLVEIVLQLNPDRSADRIMRKLQADIIRIAGIRSVGLKFKSRQIKVQYLGSRKVDQELFSVIEANLPRSSWRVLSPKPEKSAGTERTTGTHVSARVVFPDTSFTCLHYDEASELCLKHLGKAVLLDSLNLDQCYVIKVDLKEETHDEGSFDWLSQSWLEAEDGKLIKPLAWLRLPKDEAKKPAVPAAGLLVFPKIPALDFGVTLRLLRASGDGYDSINIDLARKN